MQTVCKAKGRPRAFKISLALAAMLSLVVAAGSSGFAQSSGQKTFKTPQAAAEALVQAANNHDKQMALSILGAGGDEVISSGDAEQDARSRRLFVDKYQQMHRFVKVGKSTDMLYVGAENWPLPIPLMKGKKGWYFDTAAAKREILARRVGANELDAIEVCLAIVSAQDEYQSQLHDGDKTRQYAQRFMSSDGKHDGLYWKAEGSEPKSPLGPHLALAAYRGGQSRESGEPNPYHGYIYKILTEQGKNASGGAKDYLDDGKLTKGFAAVAYPARYRNSGVVTFIVNQDGIVYQKDLGPDTEKIASSMHEYNPDKTWKRAN
jgi:Protein of unknown function (DUF2950)